MVRISDRISVIPEKENQNVRLVCEEQIMVSDVIDDEQLNATEEWITLIITIKAEEGDIGESDDEILVMYMNPKADFYDLGELVLAYDTGTSYENLIPTKHERANTVQLEIGEVNYFYDSLLFRMKVSGETRQFPVIIAGRKANPPSGEIEFK